MWDTGRKPLIGAERPWHEAIRLPGARQMRHDLSLVEVAPWKTTEFKTPVANQDWVLVLGTKP